MAFLVLLIVFPLSVRSSPRKTETSSVPESDLTFTPLQIDGIPDGYPLTGIKRCGDQLDLLRLGNGGKFKLYSLGKDRIPRPVIVMDERDASVEGATEDELLCWPSRSTDCGITVIVPKVSTIETFTLEEGIPQFDQAVCAPIGLKRICLVASHEDRTFVAILDLTAPPERRLRIIHEATQKVDDRAHDLLRSNPFLTFVPRYVVAGFSETHREWRAIVPRGMVVREDGKFREESLLVRPGSNSVEVMRMPFRSIVCPIVTRRDALYWLHDHYDFMVYGLTVDGVNKYEAPLGDRSVGARMIRHDGRWHYIDEDWWVADDLNRGFRFVNAGFPDGRGDNPRRGALASSAHFGLIYRAEDLEFFRVTCSYCGRDGGGCRQLEDSGCPGSRWAGHLPYSSGGLPGRTQPLSQVPHADEGRDAATVSQEYAPGTITIAALPFDSVAGDDANTALAETMGDMLVAFLSEAEQFTFVERSALDKVLAEKGLSLAGMAEQERSRLGGLLGATHLLIGSVTASETDVRINAHLFEVETTRIACSGSADGTTDQLLAPINEIADDLAEAMGIPLPRLSPSEIDRAPTANLHFMRGLGYHHGNMPDRAMIEFMKAHAVKRDHAGARFWLGKCFMEDEEYDHALIEFERFLTEFPDHELRPRVMANVKAMQERDEDTNQESRADRDK